MSTIRGYLIIITWLLPSIIGHRLTYDAIREVNKAYLLWSPSVEYTLQWGCGVIAGLILTGVVARALCNIAEIWNTYLFPHSSYTKNSQDF